MIPLSQNSGDRRSILKTNSPRPDVLSFDFLDDLAIASSRSFIDHRSHLSKQRIGRIGPLLELFCLDRANILPFDVCPSCATARILLLICDPRQTGRGSYIETNGARIGLLCTSRQPGGNDDTQWIVFCRKAQEAAELSLPKPIAQGIVGAMREIEENVHVHSERSRDGVVGYRGTSREFEIGVVDSGIGVLESLRKSPNYRHLIDAGTAIKTALSDGQSRFRHQNHGRGYGFRSLFTGLANLNGELRFRSADHALTIDGSAPSIIEAQLSQKINVPGFLASIVCGNGELKASH